jgi:hypothetical protein
LSRFTIKDVATQLWATYRQQSKNKSINKKP